jgi:hypothetical protein
MFGIGGLILGIILILVGLFMAFLFPGVAIHQTESFGRSGIVMGFILLIIGGILVFIP